MPELIEKIEALGKLQTMYIQIERVCGDGNLVAKGVRKAYKAIERMPTIKPERKKGHINICNGFECCSECGKCLGIGYTNYINEQPAVNRWIPCSERLPEPDTMVLVCYYGSDLIMPMQGETVTEAIARQNKVPTVTMGFLDEDGWNGADMFPMMVQPTFWMPLPEPPKE